MPNLAPEDTAFPMVTKLDSGEASQSARQFLSFLSGLALLEPDRDYPKAEIARQTEIERKTFGRTYEDWCRKLGIVEDGEEFGVQVNTDHDVFAALHILDTVAGVQAGIYDDISVDDPEYPFDPEENDE